MKKIILSVAVAAMALSTTASALEDIKVDGQAKLWYETKDAGTIADGSSNTLGNTESSYGEVVFKLGMTGKQGNVGFGTTLYQVSTMGLEGSVVSATRSGTANQDMFVGEAYITAPLGASTSTKIGKQELDTPLAFTERWNAVPNTFNAALLINSSVDNLTLIGAYVGQGSATGSYGTNDIDPNVSAKYADGGALAVAGLYKTDAIALNAWYYHLNNVLGDTAESAGTGQLSTTGGTAVDALWVDAAMKVGPANVKATAAYVTNDIDSQKAAGEDIGGEATAAVALSAGMKAGEVSLFAAGSYVTDGDLPVANTATNFKKTKLPTAGVYTDGLYVAQPGSMAFKLKAAGKLGSTGIALQGVMNMTSGNDGERMGLYVNDAAVDAIGTGKLAETLETTEVDLIVTQKLADFNLKGILMHRSFKDNDTDKAAGGIYARVIASVNF